MGAADHADSLRTRAYACQSWHPGQEAQSVSGMPACPRALLQLFCALLVASLVFKHYPSLIQAQELEKVDTFAVICTGEHKDTTQTSYRESLTIPRSKVGFNCLIPAHLFVADSYRLVRFRPGNNTTAPSLVTSSLIQLPLSKVRLWGW